MSKFTVSQKLYPLQVFKFMVENVDINLEMNKGVHCSLKFFHGVHLKMPEDH